MSDQVACLTFDVCSGLASIGISYHVENSTTKAISRVAYCAKRLLKFLLIATIERVFNELKLRVHVARKGIFSFKVCDRTSFRLFAAGTPKDIVV